MSNRKHPARISPRALWARSEAAQGVCCGGLHASAGWCTLRSLHRTRVSAAGGDLGERVGKARLVFGVEVAEMRFVCLTSFFSPLRPLQQNPALKGRLV